MTLDRAAREVELLGEAELALAIDVDRAVALERSHASVEEVLVLARERKARGDLRRRKRHAGVGELAQDAIARGLRFVVAGSRYASARRRRRASSEGYRL